jgi:excisionase family DNA binding protein
MTAREGKLLYSRKEAAQLLSVSLRSLDSLILRLELPVKRVGRRVLISRQSLEKFAVRQTNSNKSRSVLTEGNNQGGRE